MTILSKCTTLFFFNNITLTGKICKLLRKKKKKACSIENGDRVGGAPPGICGAVLKLQALHCF